MRRKANKEQGIMCNWINTLDELKSGSVNEFTQINITSGVEKEQNVKIKHEDVLFFLTGSKFLSSNISNRTILLNHQTEEGRWIKIGTCLYSIEFYCGDTVVTISAETSLKTTYNLWDLDEKRFSLCYERLTRKLQHWFYSRSSFSKGFTWTSQIK